MIYTIWSPFDPYSSSPTVLIYCWRHMIHIIQIIFLLNSKNSTISNQGPGTKTELFKTWHLIYNISPTNDFRKNLERTRIFNCKVWSDNENNIKSHGYRLTIFIKSDKYYTNKQIFNINPYISHKKVNSS